MTTSSAPILSEKSKAVLEAIMTNAGETPAGIAKIMGVSVQQVTGALSSLKKAELVTMEDGKITATAAAEYLDDATASSGSTVTTHTASTTRTAVAAGDDTSTDTNADLTATEATTSTPAVAAAPKAPVITKASLARAVFDANKDQPRKILMAMLMSTEPGAPGLTNNGANTYIYNMRKALGLVVPRVAKEVVVAETGTVTAASIELPIGGGSGDAPAAETPSETLVTADAEETVAA